MMPADRRGATVVSVRAFAKINLTLRILGARADGFHEIRTLFQAIALHDTITLHADPAGLRVECGLEGCPRGPANIVWRAADAIWRASGRRGGPSGVVARIEKAIPMSAGLGGGSSDGAAALRAFAAWWGVTLGEREFGELAGTLGADVPFFLTGGTVLGVGRGDVLFPVADLPRLPVVLVIPRFGVNTAAAYAWWDADRRQGRARAPGRRSTAWRRSGDGSRSERWSASIPPAEVGNEFEAVVAKRHPGIREIVARLLRGGAVHAALSGSGSAVFGLFEERAAADLAARRVPPALGRALVTESLDRSRYVRLSALCARRPRAGR